MCRAVQLKFHLTESETVKRNTFFYNDDLQLVYMMQSDPNISNTTAMTSLRIKKIQHGGKTDHKHCIFYVLNLYHCIIGEIYLRRYHTAVATKLSFQSVLTTSVQVSESRHGWHQFIY